jgi:hypothetical protein
LYCVTIPGVFTEINVKIVRELIALSIPHRYEMHPPNIILIAKLVPRILYFDASIIFYEFSNAFYGPG